MGVGGSLGVGLNPAKMLIMINLAFFESQELKVELPSGVRLIIYSTGSATYMSKCLNVFNKCLLH